MNPLDFVLPRIRAIDGYVPGIQPNDPEVIKLNTNENPFPVASAVRAALERALVDDRLHLYPDPRSTELRRTLAQKVGAPESRCFVGNGSDEVLTILMRTVLGETDLLVTARPTYSLYPTLAALTGARAVEVDLNDEWRMDFAGLAQAVRDAGRAKLCIVTNPNAPTGIAESRARLLDFAREIPALLLADEAYAEFGGESVADLAGTDEYPTLLACGTFSKTYSLAGQRIGWVLAHPALVAEFDKVRDSYNVGRLSQIAALAALGDEAELKRRIDIIKTTRDDFTRHLAALGFRTLPSSANFIFTEPPAFLRALGLPVVQAPGSANTTPSAATSTTGGARTANTAAHACYEHLRARKILVRYFPAPRTAGHLRITIGTREQMERVIAVLTELCKQARTAAP